MRLGSYGGRSRSLLVSTSRCQYSEISSLVGARPHAASRVVSAIVQKLSPGSTVTSLPVRGSWSVLVVAASVGRTMAHPGVRRSVSVVNWCPSGMVRPVLRSRISFQRRPSPRVVSAMLQRVSCRSTWYVGKSGMVSRYDVVVSAVGVVSWWWSVV
jgi:hypothetical protein